MAVPPGAPVVVLPRSRWRASPAVLARLLAGLVLFGAGEGLVVLSALGNSPWTVLAEGVSLHTPLAIGGATIAISVAVLLLWVPLRQRPGLGTVLNAVVVGLAIDATLAALPDPDGLPLRTLTLLGGIALVGLGSGLYLGAALGPGPRDGLMTGLHRATGLPIGGLRGAIELAALVAGAILGGTVGLGTVAFALLIGPAVATALRLLSRTPLNEL